MEILWDVGPKLDCLIFSAIANALSYITSRNPTLNASIDFERWEVFTRLGVLCGSNDNTFDHSKRINSVVVPRILDFELFHFHS